MDMREVRKVVPMQLVYTDANRDVGPPPNLRFMDQAEFKRIIKLHMSCVLYKTIACNWGSSCDNFTGALTGH